MFYLHRPLKYHTAGSSIIPKGITLNSYKPCCVIIAVFSSLSDCTLICQYPATRTNLLKHFVLPNLLRGHLFLTFSVHLLCYCIQASIVNTKCKLRSLCLTKTTQLAHGLSECCNTPSICIFANWLLISPWLHEVLYELILLLGN